MTLHVRLADTTNDNGKRYPMREVHLCFFSARATMLKDNRRPFKVRLAQIDRKRCGELRWLPGEATSDMHTAANCLCPSKCMALSSDAFVTS